MVDVLGYGLFCLIGMAVAILSCRMTYADLLNLDLTHDEIDKDFQVRLRHHWKIICLIGGIVGLLAYSATEPGDLVHRGVVQLALALGIPQ